MWYPLSKVVKFRKHGIKLFIKKGKKERKTQEPHNRTIEYLFYQGTHA